MARRFRGRQDHPTDTPPQYESSRHHEGGRVSDEPRDQTEPSSGATPNPQPAGPATERSSPARRAGSGRHQLLIAGRIAVALVAVIVLAATGWEWVIKSRADAGIISRSVQASDTDASTNDGVANSDTQMIAHISADRQHVTVLSIPRDTMIDAPTCNEWDAATGQLSDSVYPVSPGDRWHINSAYSVGGPQCSVRAIQDLTGLKIDRVIGIDFAGFKNMVDALGGITVNVCGPIIDKELLTVVAQGGVQTIQGDP